MFVSILFFQFFHKFFYKFQISIIIFSNYQHGYYIHGRSVHGKAESDMYEMVMNLKKEQVNTKCR